MNSRGKFPIQTGADKTINSAGISVLIQAASFTACRKSKQKDLIVVIAAPPSAKLVSLKNCCSPFLRRSIGKSKRQVNEILATLPDIIFFYRQRVIMRIDIPASTQGHAAGGIAVKDKKYTFRLERLDDRTDPTLAKKARNKYLPKKANIGKSANIPKKLVPSYLQKTITAD